jgi:hypothetical protein
LAARSYSFEVVSDRVAKLTVTSDEGDLRCHAVERRALIDSIEMRNTHRLGLADAPLYELHQPLVPDEGWRVSVAPRGTHLTNLSAAPDLEATVSGWAAGSRAVRGLSLLSHLPRGCYWLVRTTREPTDGSKVLLGNDWFSATPNMRELLPEHHGVSACIVGAPQDAAPSLDQPLLGIAILQATGVVDADFGIWFFPFLERGETEEHSGDLLLIVPETGDFVVDHMADYNREAPEAPFARWQSTQLPELIRRLTEAP